MANLLDLHEATEEDLVNLTKTGVMESHYLDYKSPASLLEDYEVQVDGPPIRSHKSRNQLLDELSKDVSAFANAAGGTIIYGMHEDKQKHVPVKLEGLEASALSKETLAQWIRGNIQPPIVGVHVQPVPLGDTIPTPFVYVVTIPQGTTAHQARDKKFYRRDNFSSRPMNYDEIVDVMNRVTGPRIRLHISLIGGDPLALDFADNGRWSQVIQVGISAENAGNIALYSLHRLYLERQPPGQPRRDRFDGFAPDENAMQPPIGSLLKRPYDVFLRNYTVPADPPLFPGNRVCLGTLTTFVGTQEYDVTRDKRGIYWECIAPDMRTERGGVVLYNFADSNVRIQEIPEDEVANFFVGPLG